MVCYDGGSVLQFRLGVGPDGKPLPTPNNKRVFPRMYESLVVNQDGSTYTIGHRLVTISLH